MSESFLSAVMDGLVCVERRFDAFVEAVRVGSGDAVDGDECVLRRRGAKDLVTVLGTSPTRQMYGPSLD